MYIQLKQANQIQNGVYGGFQQYGYSQPGPPGPTGPPGPPGPEVSKVLADSGGRSDQATSNFNMNNFDITNSGDITLVNSKILYLDGNDSLTISYGSTEAGIQNGSAGLGGISIGNHNKQQVQGNFSVSIGSNAGTEQGGACVALGSQAGQDSQADLTVAVGASAGQTSQKQGAVALGRMAGNYNQGEYSIAIGTEAGTNNQAKKSIVINATGSDLPNNIENAFIVKPIRGVAHGLGIGVLKYDITSGEITYSTT